MGDSYYVNLLSLTYAYKAKDILSRNHISSRIVPTPRHLIKHGCGYSLLVNANSDRIAAVLRQAGIRIVDMQKLR